MVRLTVAGLAITAVGTLITLAAWQLPKSAEPTSAETTSTVPTSSAGKPAVTAASTPSAAGTARTYLDTLGAQTGGADLVPQRDWPTAVEAAALTRPIVIRCPTNETGDKVRAVTYALNDRYRTLSGTVRPYYMSDPEAATGVTLIGGFRQRDGALTRRTVGQQFGATMAAAGSLTAEVRDADELTIQVECQAPDGVVVLDAAQVTRG